jgi:transposase-like protein
MEDYPQTLAELEARFSTEEACLDYLFQLRWPDGYLCSRCGHTKGWRVRRTLIECASCYYQSSMTAGTIFHRTRKPLTMWFRMMWWVTSLKTGASALAMQRVLGLGSYETAWTWLHKLRRAMVRPGRDRLSGRIEVDETYVGASEDGLRGRKTEKKALVVVAAQEDGKAIGRIRMARIQDASADSLEPFIEQSIEPGSVVHTDGWKGYAGVEKMGYEHEITVVARRKESASDLLPRVHHVVGLLKTWLAGTLHGAISHEHLDYYLDEFTFRFNRRTSKSRGKLFYRLVQQAVQVDPVPYNAMVKHVREHRRANHKI